MKHKNTVREIALLLYVPKRFPKDLPDDGSYLNPSELGPTPQVCMIYRKRYGIPERGRYRLPYQTFTFFGGDDRCLKEEEMQNFQKLLGKHLGIGEHDLHFWRSTSVQQEQPLSNIRPVDGIATTGEFYDSKIRHFFFAQFKGPKSGICPPNESDDTIDSLIWVPQDNIRDFTDPKELDGINAILEIYSLD